MPILKKTIATSQPGGWSDRWISVLTRAANGVYDVCGGIAEIGEHFASNIAPTMSTFLLGRRGPEISELTRPGNCVYQLYCNYHQPDQFIDHLNVLRHPNCNVTELTIGNFWIAPHESKTDRYDFREFFERDTNLLSMTLNDPNCQVNRITFERQLFTHSG